MRKEKKNEREKYKKEENNKKQNNKNTKSIPKENKPINYYQRTCKKVPMSESTKRRKLHIKQKIQFLITINFLEERRIELNLI